MLTRELAYGATPSDVRRLACKVLRVASLTLARLARRMARPPARAMGEAVFEFYADAGAPEGALYIDGRLVGYVEGVRRL